MSLFGETCERSTVGLLPTPRAIYGEHPGMSHPSQMTGMALTSSPQGIPASHSHSPGSDWARRMTATYGRKFGAYWLSCDPPDSWVRTLLGTSTWASMTCYLTWKKSVTPHGRLLFRLVPSTPRTAGIGSGLWPTPDTPSGGRSMPEGTTPTGKTPDGRKVTVGLENAARMWPTPVANDDNKSPEAHMAMKQRMKGGPRHTITSLQVMVKAEEGTSLKLNSAWVSRMMGYPDSWLDLDDSIPDGEAIP